MENYIFELENLSIIQETKAELLCWGIKSTPLLINTYKNQNPYNDKRTGNAGLHLLLGNNKIPVNIPILHQFTNNSPFTLCEENGDLFLSRNDQIFLNCSLTKFPEWYQLNTSQGLPMPKVLIVEGVRTLIGTVRNTCDYFKIGKQCTFCALGPYSGIKNKTPQDFVDTIQAATSYSENYQLHLTGGNVLNRGDRGILDYLDYVAEIRRISNIPISIEISPPENLDDIKRAVDAGVNAFSINLEIWDNKLRKLFCPAKSLISKGSYYKTWNYGLKILGPNQVCSVLVFGLESSESTLMGAEAIVKEGVIPTIIPFRKNNGSLLENFRGPDPKELIHVSRIVGNLMKQSGLEPKAQPGCTNCGGCSVEQEYM
jgi:hypothetical protein